MQFTVPYLQFCTFTFAHAFLGISCAQTVFSLVLVLVLAVATAGSVPLSTLVVGAEASYASTPRGGRLSGQEAKLGRWWRARKNRDWFRTLQRRKSQYCSQYTCIMYSPQDENPLQSTSALEPLEYNILVVWRNGTIFPCRLRITFK